MKVSKLRLTKKRKESDLKISKLEEKLRILQAEVKCDEKKLSKLKEKNIKLADSIKIKSSI